jgi:energy-converting hydrogenase Eha subunit C
MAWEAGWDIGRGSACLLAAGLVVLGAPLQATLLVSLIGVAAMLVLLRRYYADVAVVPA